MQELYAKELKVSMAMNRINPALYCNSFLVGQ